MKFSAVAAIISSALCATSAIASPSWHWENDYAPSYGAPPPPSPPTSYWAPRQAASQPSTYGASSPPSHSVENVWEIIKEKIDHFGTLPKNKEELMERVLDIWNNLDETNRNLITNLVRNLKLD